MICGIYNLDFAVILLMTLTLNSQVLTLNDRIFGMADMKPKQDELYVQYLWYMTLTFDLACDHHMWQWLTFWDEV